MFPSERNLFLSRFGGIEVSGKQVAVSLSGI